MVLYIIYQNKLNISVHLLFYIISLIVKCIYFFYCFDNWQAVITDSISFLHKLQNSFINKETTPTFVLYWENENYLYKENL